MPTYGWLSCGLGSDQLINSLHILGSATTASIHFHNKFDVVHMFMSFVWLWNLEQSAVHFFEVWYSTAIKGLPHSKQLAFSRDVINPQAGHILCA